jgi:hypothetical protein
MDHTAHDWTERLSALLDGDLPPAQRAELEAHLAGCAGCRAALEELRAIVAAAPGYQGRAPEGDLWPAIAAAIDQRREASLPARPTPRARRFSLAQLLAASIAFLVIGGGSAWLMLRGAEPAPVVATAPAVTAGPATVTPVGLSPRADSAFDGAIADLERVLAEGRGRLDTATVRVIEENLTIIDRAIAEARAAIARDPAAAYLRGAVAANLRLKFDLLRRASAAITAAES